MSFLRVRGRRFATTAGAVAAALVLASCIGFAPSAPIEASTVAGVHSGAVVWADVSGAGGQDPLVVASDGNLVHLLPCGDGCFTRGETVPLGAVGLDWPVVSADFNSDSIDDVVTSSSAGVVVYFGGRPTRPGRQGSWRRIR